MNLRRRPAADDGAQAAAVSVRTLAVLLQAGSAPTSAWRHLADSGDEQAQSVVARCDDCVPLVVAIEAQGGAWVDVAAAWEVATTVGAPLAEVLRSLAQTMLDAASAADDVRIALAEPAGTARLLLWMPFAGLLLGFALGFDTVSILVTNPMGTACLGAGLLLVLGARLWTSRLLRRARPAPGTPGMHAELVAVALAGGTSIDRSLRLVDDSPARGLVGADRTTEVLALSRAAGVPAGELLRAAAAQDRHESRVSGRMRAARLSSQLLIPLGVCTLPAFLLLGVAPLILSVLASTPLPI
ncbi:type II secretion system F family protein [Microbacterium sp.]|uniref:type II secretion system F family protein n=1 Tax=Microbacterium sp. TaxID=51671 RepID=UPI003F9714BE